MLLLSVFGTLALVSSQAGWRLADRHADWIRGVYELEGRGAILLSRVASCLKQAEILSRGELDVLNEFLYMHQAEMLLKAADLKEDARIAVLESGVVQVAAAMTVPSAENRGNEGDEGDVEVKRLEILIEVVIPSKGDGHLWHIRKWQYGKSSFVYDRIPDLWPGPASNTISNSGR